MLLDSKNYGIFFGIKIILLYLEKEATNIIKFFRE